MIWIYLLVAMTAGAMMPLQAGVNSQLARAVQHPVGAALISFMVGTIALLAYCFIARLPVPTWDTFVRAPWWMWTGGLMGAFFVAVAAAFAPKLGAATFISIVIAGQILVSLVIDQYGFVGFAVRPINGWRVAGAIMLVIGVALIRRF